jgi:hypothetical protein
MGMKARDSADFRPKGVRSAPETFSKGATGMDMSVLYVGLDYHQNSVRVCAMNHEARAERSVALGIRLLFPRALKGHYIIQEIP